jgi:hypothetical protein
VADGVAVAADKVVHQQVLVEFVPLVAAIVAEADHDRAA